MKTISFVCQKGGTGKTTLALSIAAEGLTAGLTVAVIDLDPQVSACIWSDLRAHSEPHVIDAQPARIEAVVNRAREMGVDLLLVDTAGHTEQAALAGARVADLVLVPLQPSVMDLKTVKTTINLLDLAGAKERLVVLTRVKSMGRRHEETGQWLADTGVSVCPAILGDRVAFQDAYARGLGVCEFDARGRAAMEVHEVYKYVSRKVSL